jgi:hypothetical protein
MSSKKTITEVPEDAQEVEIPGTVLPIKGQLKLGYLFSLLIVVLTIIASVGGIVFSDDIYPTAELQQNSVPNDIVTLFVGLPILLGSMWLTRRGILLGLLFWPGAIFYGLYNYFVYLFGMPLTAMYPVYLAIVTLSIYTTIGLVASIDSHKVKKRLSGQVTEGFAGWVLVGLGVLFILLAVSVIAGGLSSNGLDSRQELGLASADVILATAWIIGGVMLLKQQALGYVGGTGLLFMGSMLFVGLILFLLLQPLLTDAEFVLTDVVVTFIMGLTCFFPFGLFLRGVIRSQ